MDIQVPIYVYLTLPLTSYQQTNTKNKNIYKKMDRKKIILHFYVDSAVKITDTEHQKFTINIFQSLTECKNKRDTRA